MQQIRLMSKFGLALIAITAISVVMATHAYYIQAADAQAKLPNNSVRSETIVNGQVLTQDIGDGTIQEQDIADGVIPSGNMQLDTHVVTESTSLSQNNGVVFGAECEEGDLLTGGGFATAKGVEIIQSHPFEPQEWIVEAFNPQSTTFTVEAYAVCLDLTP